MALIQTSTLKELVLKFDENGFVGARQTRTNNLVDSETGEVMARNGLKTMPLENTEEINEIIGQQIILMATQIKALEKSHEQAGYVKSSNHRTINTEIVSDLVKHEADLRIMAIIGVDSYNDMKDKIYEGHSSSIRLLNKGKENWTDDDIALANYLEETDNKMQVIRKHESLLKAMEPIPDNFKNDQYWT